MLGNYLKKVGARRLLIMILGNVFLGMGVGIFKLSGMGNDPFSGMVMGWKKIPYFWQRMSNDAICALVCYLAGGIVGLGTLLCALGLGPFIHFFTERVSKKLVGPIGEKGEGISI